jgi:outer membrane immunogenic protein
VNPWANLLSAQGITVQPDRKHLNESAHSAAGITGGVANAADFLDGDSFAATTVAPSWSGPYVGASLGYGWLRDIDRAFDPPIRASGEDVVFGGHFGYLHQFDRFVFGAEGDFTRLKINFEGFPIDAENSFAIKARGGFAFDRLLLTGHGGAVYATTNIGLKDWGWVVGAGADYLLTDNFVVGISYDHMWFSRFDGTLIDAKLDLLRLRVGVKF